MFLCKHQSTTAMSHGRCGFGKESQVTPLSLYAFRRPSCVLKVHPRTYVVMAMAVHPRQPPPEEACRRAPGRPCRRSMTGRPCSKTGEMEAAGAAQLPS